ncbi:uncharacterized protein LOC128430106 [Pleuronectes platessa]|uniref:uncharacterized protein LOC128430106 n=1 Tax=Pleuronectes platessa TaxID=8262 RepID=UPI00232A0DC7|nr:uncharacterized protein LOC128430106 [Pleuronectes platessa]XP_053272056.1 uncharacterized protein LOC128430106 [Pleuronectes platessa]
MEDPRRCSTLSFSFILCFTLWLTPGETYNFWDQCIDECPTKNYFTSTYNVQCSDRCEKRGSDYYWCYSFKGWDYCSPVENIDYKGSHCNNACGKHGERYNWCKLSGGSWGYCGRVEPRAMIYYTRYQRQCVDSCQYYESEEYFWCHDGDDWEYCSPLQDHTYKNEPCRFNHQCGSYGESYTWCYTTDNNDWDYCGVIGPGECVFSQTSRAKRQPDNPKVICTREDKDNDIRIVTTFREEGSSSNIAPTNKASRKKALDLINKWKNQGLIDNGKSKSNLIKSEYFRIDNQGAFTRNNQRYYNLQIQINGPRRLGCSTSVAHIIVPVDTSAEYMRLAFTQSLELGVGVLLEVNEASTSTNKNQKCCRRRKH